MTPRISNGPFYRLTVPELSGGINLRDGMSLIQDNQLTKCKNVWYKDGALRTRPGFVCSDEELNIDNFPESELVEPDKIYNDPKNFRVIDGVTYFLVVLRYSDMLRFRYYSEAGKYFNVANVTDLPPDKDFTINVFQHNSDIYCFCSGYYEEQETPYYIFKITEKEDSALVTIPEFECVKITDESEEIYAPIVMMNCETPGGMTPFEIGAELELTGDYMEGYNMFGNYYRMLYSSVNKKIFEGSPETYAQAATYELLHPIIKGKKVIVKVRWRENSNDVVDDIKLFTHEVTVSNPNDWNYEIYDKNNPPKDGVYMKVSGRTLCFMKCGSEDQKTFKLSDYIDMNNMEIIAPCPNSKENYEKVLNMTCSEWFGGGSEGIYGGIHLFLGGNTKDEEKALVCWSDMDRPLYFSENGYAYAGDKSQRVTAFGKQGESLIIFKERETYATQYASNSSPMVAADVENNAIVDIAASEVTFPMVQVHGFLGCDCPDTVQLCRNRLVWAHSDGKVYTLVSANQWNERSIFEVSAMIEPEFKGLSKENLRNAISADWEGHYVLFAGNKFYLMDYNSYGYANVASYSKDEDAQVRIPWWIWDAPNYNMQKITVFNSVYDQVLETELKPVKVKNIISIGGRLFVWIVVEAFCTGTGLSAFTTMIELADKDAMADTMPRFSKGKNSFAIFFGCTKEPITIPSMLQTKLYDFGSPTMVKTVPKTEMSFGANNGIPISITTITDRAQSEQEIVVDNSATDDTDPAFFTDTVVRNGQRLNNRIGYKIESQGNLCLDAISIYYKHLKGAK